MSLANSRQARDQTRHNHTFILRVLYNLFSHTAILNCPCLCGRSTITPSSPVPGSFARFTLCKVLRTHIVIQLCVKGTSCLRGISLGLLSSSQLFATAFLPYYFIACRNVSRFCFPRSRTERATGRSCLESLARTSPLSRLPKRR